MRFLPRLLTLLALVLLPAVTAAQSNDEKDIRAIGAQIQSAWNKADPKELADLFLTDGDYVSSTGRTARGRDELQKAFAAQWGGIYKGTKLSHTLTNIRFVRKDVAIADGAFEISGMRDHTGKILPTRTGLSTVIASKKGDRWYVAGLRGMIPSTGEGGGK
jgi:uncharacterized protein (TIGR02246 family)